MFLHSSFPVCLFLRALSTSSSRTDSCSSSSRYGRDSPPPGIRGVDRLRGGLEPDALMVLHLCRSGPSAVQRRFFASVTNTGRRRFPEFLALMGMLYVITGAMGVLAARSHNQWNSGTVRFVCKIWRRGVGGSTVGASRYLLPSTLSSQRALY